MKDSIEDFIVKIENEFENTPSGSLNPDTNFRNDFEWSSVNALILFSMINIEYDVILTAEDIQPAHTISDLYQIVSKKLQ
ncbi:MAG: acyl carrier protein [Marinilabiliales bacterium]|nr:MAG: acyl carrier protein [Marinilabiliales bacterium]